MLIKDIWFYTADEQGSKQSKANLLTQSNFFFFAYYSSHVFIVMLSNITVPQFVAEVTGTGNSDITYPSKLHI